MKKVRVTITVDVDDSYTPSEVREQVQAALEATDFLAEVSGEENWDEARCELDVVELDACRGCGCLHPVSDETCYCCHRTGVALEDVEVETNPDYPDGKLETIQLCGDCRIHAFRHGSCPLAEEA